MRTASSWETGVQQIKLVLGKKVYRVDCERWHQRLLLHKSASRDCAALKYLTADLRN